MPDAAMKILLSLTCFMLLWVALPPVSKADNLSAYSQPQIDEEARKSEKEYNKYLYKANQYSLKYLKQARNFRVRGRFELAKQYYLQALAICADEQSLKIIQRELDGTELLLRTMR